MNPFYFGDSASPLFGVYTPARGTASKGSVVLCYPIGAEYMRAHRAYRQLTNLLSRAGFDVLRFDYSHTGDSAGDAIDSSLAGWIQDLGTAIEEMKEMTGHAEVSLAGLRMGAAIAATAAAARDDIRHLVLWDPVVRGDAYAADLRLAADSALESANGKGPTLGVAGFPISPDLLAEVTAVDLLGLVDDLPPADVVVSEPVPSTRPCSRPWSRSGRTPAWSSVPHQQLDGGRRFRVRPDSVPDHRGYRSDVYDVHSSDIRRPAVRERAILFGKTAKMVGILCEPDAPDPSLPAVLFLNSGILHRVGGESPVRETGPAMAEEGFISLRFDFSGVGDSEARKDPLRFEQSSVIEAREALDHLQSVTGVNRFVVAGLCSGADVGFWTSQEDDRVIGLAQMDAFVYRTWRFQFNRIAPRILSPKQWAHSIKVRVLPNSGPERDDDSYVDPEYSRVFPPRREVSAGLQKLVARGVELFFFFSGDDSMPYNYRDQYKDCFRDVDFGSCLRLEYEPEADHIVSDLAHQEFVVDSMVQWIQSVARNEAVSVA